MALQSRSRCVVSFDRLLDRIREFSFTDRNCVSKYLPVRFKASAPVKLISHRLIFGCFEKWPNLHNKNMFIIDQPCCCLLLIFVDIFVLY